MTDPDVFCLDHLTGLGDLPDNTVAPVRVEVIQHGAGAEGVAALRESVALAQQRLNAVHALQQECDQLRTERDQLLQELAEARGQLAEVAALQRQLQQALEPRDP